jgi:hypothetical protein
MKHRTFACLPVVALLWWSMPAESQNLVGEMGEARFNLFMPQGYCMPDRSNSNERFFADYLTKALGNAGNKVMRIMADCAELKARRANAQARIIHYMVYYFVASEENTKLEGAREATRKAGCDDLRAQTDDTIKDTPEISERTAREMKSTGSVKSAQYLGVQAEDDHGCYGAILTRVDGGNGNVFVLYVIVLRSVIHAKDVWASFYSDYAGPAANAKALQFAKTTAAALDQKNPE